MRRRSHAAHRHDADLLDGDLSGRREISDADVTDAIDWVEGIVPAIATVLGSPGGRHGDTGRLAVSPPRTSRACREGHERCPALLGENELGPRWLLGVPHVHSVGGGGDLQAFAALVAAVAALEPVEWRGILSAHRCVCILSISSRDSRGVSAWALMVP